ncbi:MAG: FimV/HubP family polar landmark protein [Steroidobacteraceae bacterium]
MNKNALRLLVASALLSPATLYALGLGEIRLNSALNQPFDAEIEVVSASTDELDSLKVTLASEDMFRRYGLDRPSFLTNFSVRVESANAGRPVIKLRSPNAVTEPFLNLLVEVSWTGGRVLREYTVLLDPPVFAPAADQQQILAPRGRTETPATAAGAIERAEPAGTVAAPATPASKTTAVMSRAAVASGDSYTVKPADTLSRIAREINADTQTTAQQTMVALYRANPQAFAGNMNVLRAGSVLRIPVTADIQALSNSEASAEIARQYGAWRNSGPVNASGATTERLRLVPAEQGGAAVKAAGQSGNDAAGARVQELEAQLAEARRLLDLRNAELAQMQKRLAAAAPGTTASSPAQASDDAATVSSEAASAADQVVEEPPAGQEATPPAPAATKPSVETPAQPGPGLFERLSQYGLWLILAGLALIAGLIAYFRRRQQLAEEDDSGATWTASDFESHLSRSPVRARPAEDPEAHVDTDEHEALNPGVARAPAFTPAAPIPQLSEDTLSSETAIHVDQQDALAEADFHMAYGLYDQAADIVKLAIERQPDRRDLKLKLAEIFFVWGNKDSFLEIAQQLHDAREQAAAGEWDKVLIMGKQICPDDPLFAGDIAGSRSADSVDVNLEGGEHHVDIDLYDAPEGDQPKSDVDFELAATGSHVSADDTGLDFLLDEPQRGVDEEPTREMDASNARTQETPTIESPFVHDSGSATIREKLDQHLFDADEMNVERTAELSLDEIGLDVSALENTGTVDDETQIADDEMTRMASLDRSFAENSETKTMLAPHMDELELPQEESTGNTITIEQIDLDSGNTAEQLRPSVDGTGMFKATQKIDVDMDRFELNPGDTVEQPRPETSETGIFRATQKIDMDLDYLADAAVSSDADTLKSQGRVQTETDIFSDEVFGGADDGQQTVVDHKLDGLHDTNITELNATELMSGEFQLPEMEPVTMSEVGTKLDLARAYMDMGDPDGARSILQEVLEEGNGSQKQEAQRLLDSIG